MSGRVHVEWGRHAIEQFAARSNPGGVIVIVDVLSFSTAVDVAVGRRAIIHPFAQGDHTAAHAYAASIGAVCAGRRGEQGPSLSPGSLVNLTAGTRLVLPSPNGSQLRLSCGDRPTFTGCLRNAHAVAEAVRSIISDGDPILIVAAGERWSNGSLRPAIEDWLGAGRIALRLVTRGRQPTPEAEAAMACTDALGDDGIARVVRGSMSGIELTERGYDDDVELATEIDTSNNVPRLIEGAYQQIGTRR